MRAKIKKLMMLSLLFIAINIQAQEFNFGLSSGADITNIRLSGSMSDKYVEYKPTVAFNLNAFAAYRSAGFLGITAEPGFIFKGAKVTDVYSTEKHKARWIFPYLQLPLLADFYLTDKLYLSVGPEFSYMIAAKIYYDAKFTDISYAYDNKFEVSGMAAINYTILPKVDIALRYSHGFTKTTQIDFTDIHNEPLGHVKEYNQYLQLLLRARIFSTRQ
ncbi:MAG: PorT family protein [Clostridia bacterium]|nr:PorT family protein [Clostridia bacterium]